MLRVAFPTVESSDVTDVSSIGHEAATVVAEPPVRRTNRVLRQFLPFEPASGRALPQLDGLRALAVIAIFLRHAWGLSGSPVYLIDIPFIGEVSTAPFVVMMSNGVDLFFVLSGFLLARSFILADYQGRSRPNLRRYARLRVFRILPAYWLVLAMVPMMFVPSLVREETIHSWNGFWAFLTYIPVLQTLSPWAYGSWSAVSPFWTLTIEVMFYAMCPWLARAFFRNRWRWALPLSLAISLGWLALLRTSPGYWAAEQIAKVFHGVGAPPEYGTAFLRSQFPTFLFSFACGMTVANLWARSESQEGGFRSWRPRWRRASITTGWLIVGVSMWQLGYRTWNNQFYDGGKLARTSTTDALIFHLLEAPAMALGFGLVLLGLVLGEVRHPFLSSIPMRIIGVLGFSIYLWHMPVLYTGTKLTWLQRLDPHYMWPAAMVRGGIVTLALSAVTWLLLERPMIERGRRKKSG